MNHNTLKSYCLTCHDNTTWTQYSLSVAIDNYENRGKKVTKAQYTCNECGRANIFINYIY